MKERKLLTWGSWAVLLGLLLLCGLAFGCFAGLPKGNTAVVERNGQVILRQRMDITAPPEEITVTGENGIELVVILYPDGAAVKSSGCPDQICVNMGKLTRAGEAAICLPARVTLRLEGDGADGMTY